MIKTKDNVCFKLFRYLVKWAINQYAMHKNNGQYGQHLQTAMGGPAINVIQSIVNFRTPEKPLNLKLILTLNDNNEPEGRDSIILLRK